MNQKTRMFGVAVLILTLVTAAILGLASSPGNPLTWLLIGALLLLPLLHRKLTSAQYLEWKDEYSVGIQSIDVQHKKLVNLINNLQTAVSHSTGAAFEQAALDELVDYTKTHFQYEESLMQETGYPDFEAHRAEHQKMIARVEEVIAEYQQDQDTAMQNALAFLKDWLIHHINGTDKEYSGFLLDKGVR